jgi:LmbE family N-acetylglucosaminyl deacetylase
VGEEFAGDFKQWLAFVRRFADAYEAGRQISAAQETIRRPSAGALPEVSGPRVIICSPHPDDEMLSGALALRLQREADCSVLVLALTLGSDPARKENRKKELAAACQVAGFEWRLTAEPLAWSVLRPELESDQASGWQRLRETLVGHFEREAPFLVLAPHVGESHPAHLAAHRLVRQALTSYTEENRCEVLLAETEYWQPLPRPNLLVGVASEDLALLLAALARHRGEMARHPYHLRQPARMMDSVRRGSEVLVGFGEAAADPVFGELYHLLKVSAGKAMLPKSSSVVHQEDRLDRARLATLFEG